MPSTQQSKSSTSPSLIQRARQHDADAWQRLCDIYAPLVYQWARRAGLQDQDAADIGQEVFRTVASRIQSFRKDEQGDTFRGWLRNITRNKLGDFIRVAREKPRAAGGTGAHQLLGNEPELLLDPESDPELNEEGTVLHGALNALRVEFEETTWQAFWRSTVDEQPNDVIATDFFRTRTHRFVSEVA